MGPAGFQIIQFQNKFRFCLFRFVSFFEFCSHQSNFSYQNLTPCYYSVQMLGELAVASDEQHATAELMFRNMKETFYSRWDPQISAVELDCVDLKVLQELETAMITHTLEGNMRQFFDHLCVLLIL